MKYDAPVQCVPVCVYIPIYIYIACTKKRAREGKQMRVWQVSTFNEVERASDLEREREREKYDKRHVINGSLERALFF